MTNNNETHWKQIQTYIQDTFHVSPEIHTILFLIGIQELGYGFQQLDKDTKTKVINFASIYILNYIDDSIRENVKENVINGEIKESDSEEYIYKLAIINYFLDKEII